MEKYSDYCKISHSSQIYLKFDYPLTLWIFCKVISYGFNLSKFYYAFLCLFIYFNFIDYMKTFVWITSVCGKFLKRQEYQTTLPASWETCMQVKKQQNRTWNNRLVPNWGGVGGRYIKGVYCHPHYLMIYRVCHEKCWAG